MYRIIATDAYDLSETEYTVAEFEHKEDAHLYLIELRDDNKHLVSEMEDYGYTKFYKIEEV